MRGLLHFFHFGNRSAEVVHSQLQQALFPAEVLRPRPVVDAEPPVHALRDRALQERPERLRLFCEIFLQPLVPALVQKDGLVIPGVHVLVLGKERADGDGKHMAVQDLFVFDFKYRRADLAADHLFRRFVVGEIVRG